MGHEVWGQLHKMSSLGTLNSPYDLVQSLDLSQSLSKTGVQVISERGISGAYVGGKSRNGMNDGAQLQARRQTLL